MSRAEAANNYVEKGQDYLRYECGSGRLSIVGECYAQPAELALIAPAAIQHRRLDELQKLPGSYSIVLEQGDESIINVDPSGQYPIFWRSRNGELDIAQEAGVLGASRVDAEFLAANIIGCPDLVIGQTALAGVHKIEGGQTAHFKSARLQALEEAGMASDPLLTLEEAATELRRALEEAVDVRVASGKTITSDFSGGFDSTTLALLTADHSQQGLDAFIQYLPRTGTGDLRYARAIAADNPAIRLHEIHEDVSALPYQHVGRRFLDAEPDLAITLRGRYLQRLQAARDVGSTLHLLGEGGDVVLDGNVGAVADLARQGRTAELEEACVTYGRTYARSPRELFEKAKSAASRTLRDDLLYVAQVLRAPESVEDSDSVFRWTKIPSGAVKFLTDSMRKRLSEVSERRAMERRLPEHLPLSDYLSSTDLRQAGDTHKYVQAMARTVGLEVSIPYLDRAVATACMRLSARFRSAAGVFKPILQAAFPDIIPNILAKRTTKGTYDTAAYRGLRKALPIIQGLFDKDCRLGKLEVIRPEAVRAEIDGLDMGWPGAFPALDQMIVAEAWLRQQDL